MRAAGLRTRCADTAVPVLQVCSPSWHLGSSSSSSSSSSRLEVEVRRQHPSQPWPHLHAVCASSCSTRCARWCSTGEPLPGSCTSDPLLSLLSGSMRVLVLQRWCSTAEPLFRYMRWCYSAGALLLGS